MTPGPDKSVLVCTLPRSGSNLLVGALRSTGVCGVPGEYFTHAMLQRFAAGWQVDPHDKSAYWQAMLQHGTTANGVFGIKLFPAHLHRVQAYANAHHHTTWSVWQTLQQAFPAPQWVSLTRDNKIKQAISLVRAEQEGVWTAAARERKTNAREAAYDYQHITTRLMNVLYMEQMWEQFFCEYGLQPLRLTYEALTNDYEASVRAVLRHTGIGEAETVPIAPPKTQREADDLNADWYARYLSDAQWLRHNTLQDALCNGGTYSFDLMSAVLEYYHGGYRSFLMKDFSTPPAQAAIPQWQVHDAVWVSQRIPASVLLSALWNKLRRHAL